MALLDITVDNSTPVAQEQNRPDTGTITDITFAGYAIEELVLVGGGGGDFEYVYGFVS